MTKVVHCKKTPYDVYIGRGSKWGNPFKIPEDGTREEVIEKYRQYLLYNKKHGKDLPDNEQLLKALPELKGRVLGCYCKPKACHGDILASLAEGGQGNEG